MTAPMTCEELLERLFGYLDREVDAEVAAAIENHLEACRACFSRAEFERKLKGRVRDAGEHAVSESLRAKLRLLIERF